MGLSGNAKNWANHQFTEEDERFVESLIPAGQQIPAEHVNHFLPVTGRQIVPLI